MVDKIQKMLETPTGCKLSLKVFHMVKKLIRIFGSWKTKPLFEHTSHRTVFQIFREWTRFCILRVLSTDQSCQNGFLFGVSRLFFHLFEFFQGHFFPYFLLISCSQKWSIHVLFLTSFLIYSLAVAPLSKNLALFHIRLESSET